MQDFRFLQQVFPLVAPTLSKLSRHSPLIVPSLAPVNCVSVDAHVKCPEESSCGLYGVMLEVRNAVANVLDNTSLRDVARRTLDLVDRRSSVTNYAI